MIAVAVVAGLFIGVALGSLGGGGSILAVPVLVYLLGQDARTATTGSLVIVGVSALVAATRHSSADNVRWRQGALFGLLGALGAYAGSHAAAGIDPDLLLALFSVLLLVVAALMVRRSLPGDAPREEPGSARTPPPARLGKGRRLGGIRLVEVVLAATAVGLLTGFFGVGGGFVIVPMLVLVLGYPMPVAVGTSLVVIAVNSATALASRLSVGIDLDWVLIGTFTALAVVGSVIGAQVATRLPALVLTRAFAGLLVLVATYTGVRSVVGLVG